jgi:hypothetical protein
MPTDLARRVVGRQGTAALVNLGAGELEPARRADAGQGRLDQGPAPVAVSVVRGAQVEAQLDPARPGSTFAASGDTLRCVLRWR